MPERHGEPTESPQRKARERCVILCEDMQFSDWIFDHKARDVETIEVAVRQLIGAKSRAEIETDPAVYERWRKLVGEYDDFLRYGERANGM